MAGRAKKYKAGHFNAAEARREYQRRYYQMHKEKAKEYQRLYNLTHKKKRGGKGKANFKAPREAAKLTFSLHDIQGAAPEKVSRMVNQITSGERMYTI